MLQREQEQHGRVAVHSLPIKTTFRGMTDIDANFTQHILRSESGELRNAFRGRTLIGREMQLPASYALVCASFAKQSPATAPDAAGRSASSAPALAQVEATAGDVHIALVTDRFCIWEHDKPPTHTDALRHWFELSHAVHLAS